MSMDGGLFGTPSVARLTASSSLSDPPVLPFVCLFPAPSVLLVLLSLWQVYRLSVCVYFYRPARRQPVSYTHLDVYKRQV